MYWSARKHKSYTGGTRGLAVSILGLAMLCGVDLKKGGEMIEIFVFVILVAMFFVDHRLQKLVKIQQEILVEIKRQHYERKAETELTK